MTNYETPAERQARRGRWADMNRILDREGPNSPAYREAFDAWVGMWADTPPKPAGEVAHPTDTRTGERWELGPGEFAAALIGAAAFGFAVALLTVAVVVW